MVPKNVVIVSDCVDVANVEMRQAILTSYAANSGSETAFPTIEPLVRCEPYSLTNVAFLTRLLAETAPPSTLIMVIANFIRERTERIIGTLKDREIFFEGTNTGAFGWLVSDFGVENCFELDDPGFVPFGGKFVHAPAVGRALAGVPLEHLGRPFSAAQIRIHRPSVGEIVHIDNFGNAKIMMSDVPCDKESWVTVEAVNSTMRPFSAIHTTRMMDQETGTWVLYRGSSLGLYELGQVRSQGFLDLPVQVGSSLRLIVQTSKSAQD